ncbi:type IV pilin [Methanoregula formicica]|nr:type IV pilin N-terminal domain-containing protein [Methanoregula formicica]
MAFTKNDEAVSPVIGVILMVAITVILAAVIAAFVFGMAGNVQKTKVISTTVQRTASGVTVKYMGGADANSFTHGIVTIDGATDYGNSSGTINANSNILGNTLGSFVNATTTSKPARVMVIGKFSDGSDQILQDTNV